MSDSTETIAAMRAEIDDLRKQVAELRDIVAGRKTPNLVNPALCAMMNVGLLEDRHPSHTDERSRRDPKRTEFHELQEVLGPKSSGVTDAIHMLATFCFDLSRRFAVLHFAVGQELRDVEFDVDDINPDLRPTLNAEDAELNPPPARGAQTTERIDWAKRAAIAAEQLRRWHDAANDQVEKHRLFVAKRKR